MVKEEIPIDELGSCDSYAVYGLWLRVGIQCRCWLDLGRAVAVDQIFLIETSKLSAQKLSGANDRPRCPSLWRLSG